MRRKTSLLLAAVATLSLLPVDAVAQPGRAGAGNVVLAAPRKGGKKSDQDQAAEHFKSARNHYSNGRYGDAIEELEAAVALDPNGAELVYNLGVIYEKLQDVDNAIVNYRRYVGMIDDTEEQERVTKIIQRLEGARDELAAKEAAAIEAAEKERGPDNQEENKASKGRLDGLVIGAGVVSALGFAGGTYFGLKAMSDRADDSPKTGPGTTYQDLQDNADRAKREALYADIGFGVGVAAGVTALVLYYTRDAVQVEPKVGEEDVAIVPSVLLLPGGAAASVRLGF